MKAAVSKNVVRVAISPCSPQQNLRFERFHFPPILLQLFIVFFFARAKINWYRFFNFDPEKKLCFVQADQEE